MKKTLQFILITMTLFIYIQTAFSKEQMTIMVDEIQNRSGKANDWIAESIVDTIIGDLSQIKGINVISTESRATALQEIKMSQTGLLDSREDAGAGHMLSANIVLKGSYTVIRDKIRIVVKLTDVKTGSVYRTVKLDGNTNSLFNLQDKIVHQLLSEVEKIDRSDLKKIKITTEDRNKIARSKTKIDPAAYKLYTKGLKLRDRDPKTALQLFKSAFEISPDFANAYIEAAHCAGFKLRKFKEAMNYMGRADALYLRAGRDKTLSYYKIYQKYAYIYYAKKDYDTSLKYMFRLIKHFEKHNFTKTTSFSYSYSIIGTIYHKKKDTGNFTKYYRKAIAIAEKLDNVKKYSSAPIYEAYARFAYSHKLNAESLKYYPVAIDYFEKYYKHLKINKNLSQARTVQLKLAKAMTNHAFISAKTGNFNTAQNNIHSAKNLLEKLGLKKNYNYGKLHYIWGEYYRLKKDYKQAEMKYIKAIQILESVNMKKSTYRMAKKRLNQLMNMNNTISDSKTNLIKNGDFEKEFKDWGTGLYSKPDHKNSIIGFWGSAKAYAAFILKNQPYKKRKSRVLVMRNYSSKAPHVYKTIAQRISGLKKNTDYVLEYMAYVKDGKPGVLFFTFDPAWGKRSYTPMNYEKWGKYRYVYNTGNSNYVDLRIITENTGEVWVDDVKFFEK